MIQKKNATKKPRMLPSDFQKYLKVKNTKKSIKKEEGLFVIPDELKGSQDTPERPFLVFYFDSDKHYETVKKLLEIHGTGARSHPDLDSKKLFRICKRHIKGRG